MSQLQRVIKYASICFAIFLIVNIFSGIYNLGFFVTSSFTSDKKEKDFLNEYDFNSEEKIININTRMAKLYIKNGDTLKVETDNNYIETKQKGNIISITEKKHSIFNNDNQDVILYVPNDMCFDKVLITNGAGLLNIDTLETKRLDLELGAGKININSLIVNDKADIESGAGEVNINYSEINNLDLDIGVGKFTLNTSLMGNNEIDAGIGGLDINILGEKDNYRINLDNGIGSIRIDGKNVKTQNTLGDGTVLLDIDGGIGSINIDFISKVEKKF